MSYLVIICAIVSICLVILSKVKDLSIIYPTLMIILTIILNIVSNAINERRIKKDNIKVDIDNMKK